MNTPEQVVNERIIDVNKAEEALHRAAIEYAWAIEKRDRPSKGEIRRRV
ncbi:MAG: hypothetical protein QOJ84_149 [Bradyrhizobium sp.]|jgi:hypothetical protein|nr:hypothetical protein [Bradyrhizobium sp.]